MRRVLLLGMLLVLGAASVSPAQPFELQSTRASDDAGRRSVLLVVRNISDQPVEIASIQLNGKDLAEWTAPDPKDHRKRGRGIDWVDIRPRRVPAGRTSAIFLGYATPEAVGHPLRMTLTTADDRVQTIPVAKPIPESLRIVRFAFDEDLGRLTLLVRNEADRPQPLRTVELNGRRVSARFVGSPVAPGMLGRVLVNMPSPLELGEDCTAVVHGPGATATAWFRAHPAASLTYMFYGHHCDKEYLRRRNIQVPVTHEEGNAEVARQIDRNGGEIPDDLARRMAQRARSFGRNPDAWTWYMQDDAGWGRPTPQSIVKLGTFLRAHGSPQLQTLCNPADNERYAWTCDQYLNYSYHTTHRQPDPTVFTGGRSVDRMVELNEPAPVIYLVDAVGQSSRWVNRAEEELASYAILGRGATHPGWFLGASLWEQGGRLGGGIDHYEVQPWRYQEGLTANTPLADHIARIAAVCNVLSPHLAEAAKLPGHVREDMLEVLPLLGGQDVVVTVLLNRRLHCTYPRDHAGGRTAGYVRLQPRRDVTVRHPLPGWVQPTTVLAWDHDRGVRRLPFTVSDGTLTAMVDAVDSAGLLLACPNETVARRLIDALSAVEPSTGSSPIRPDATLTAADATGRTWDVAASHRAPVRIAGPVEAGQWIRVELPDVTATVPSPVGWFDPTSVRAVLAGKALDAKVDFARKVFAPAGQVGPFAADGEVKVQVTADRQAVTLDGRYPHGKYGWTNPKLEFDGNYDRLSIEARIDGTMYPMLRATTDAGPRTLNLDGILRHQQEWPISRRLPATQGRPLPRVEIDVRELFARDARKQNVEFTRMENLHMTLQVRDGRVRFGRLVQSRSRPIAWLRSPRAVAAGEHLAGFVYWSYADQPAAGPAPQAWPDAGSAVAARAGEATGFGLSGMSADVTATGLRSLRLVTAGQADRGWVEARDPAGRLCVQAPLRSARDGVWKPAGPVALPSGKGRNVTWTAWLAAAGRTVAVHLCESDATDPLRPAADVSGQVETLSAAPDGSFCLVGSDKVYAVSADGTVRWSADLGTHRRQQGRFGPGRNIDTVAIAPDGRSAFAWTYHFDPKAKQYSEGLLVVFDPAGRELARKATHWKTRPTYTADGLIRFADPAGQAGAIDPATGEDQPAGPAPADAQSGDYELRVRGLPGRSADLFKAGRKVATLQLHPYPLHRRVLADGRSVVATTQGRLTVYRPDGSRAVDLHRSGRIDDLLVDADRGLLAIAYKRYPRRWDWQAEPVVEIISLDDGDTVGTLRGGAAGDRGQLGTDLRLAAGGDRVYLGDTWGRVFVTSWGD